MVAVFEEERQLDDRLKSFQQIFLPALKGFFADQTIRTPLNEDLIQDMLEKLNEFTLRGGKRVRPSLVYYGYQGFTDADPTITLPVAIASEIMQSFLLIHDDIMDEATVRRGGKTVHKGFLNETDPNIRYAESMGMLVGDIAGYLGVEAIGSAPIEGDSKWRLMALYARTCIDVCYGQALDIIPSHTCQLTEPEVYNIYIYKTACYSMTFPLLCAALLAEQDKETEAIIRKLGRSMGILFQIQDDILGLFGNPCVIGKSVESDVQQGKKTLLICKAWERADTGQREYLQTNYGNPLANFREISIIKDIVTDTGALEYAEGVMETEARQAKEMLRELGLREIGDSFIKQLIDQWKQVNIERVSSPAHQKSLSLERAL